AHLRRGEPTGTRVIVSGTPAQIDAIAMRHGVRVRRRLQAGAVLDVPAGRLAGLAEDPAVDQMAADQVVRSHMAVTNATIGADLVQSGQLTGGRGLTGTGIGVAVIDSGVANVPALRGRIVANVDFTDDRGRARVEYGHGTHVAG